jgi:hypothetical protein
MWGGTGTGSMFRNQWSPEEEKQVRNRERKMQEITKGVKRNLPRGNRPLLLGKRHADFLPLSLLNGFRLRPDPAFLAGTCAGRRSVVQLGSIYHIFIRDSW